MQVILTPYFLEKYKSDYHSVKKDGWVENIYNGSSQEFNEIITALNRQIAEFIQMNVDKNILPVSIGGDCHKTFGVLKGLNNSGINPTLLWLDAHGDFNTHKTSPSGFVGGMSLAILAGHEEPELLRKLDLNPIPEEKVIIFDRRNLDPEEAFQLKSSRVRQPSNLENLIEECKKETVIYLHIDADIINPIDAPAMLYQAKGGPRLSDLKKFIKEIKEKIAAVSVTLWEPSLDSNKQTENAVLELIQLCD